ncbi:sensor histidine kinase [Gloeobacter violaceus]|nr:sensor histidine kinase [Gloeobacter violaceus]
MLRLPALPQPSLRWTVLCAEWTLLAMITVLELLNNNSLAAVPMMAALLGFTGIFWALSFYFPLEAPAWKKKLYIAAELMLAFAAMWIGIGYDTLIYLILIKSCLFLGRGEVILTVVITAVFYLLTTWRQQFADDSETLNIGFDMLNASIYHLGISTFVILLGFVIVAERRSRARAEELAEELEGLAANLERARIARDIHDSLGHTLTALDVKLEVAQELYCRDPDRARQAVHTAKQLSGQCLQDVRLAVQAMRRPPLHLDAALEGLAEQVRQNRALAVEVHIDLPQLPLQTSHQLYCIVQEGLTNIQRHARAARVSLRACHTPQSVTLELWDDGQGFDPQATHGGFGLRGMHERMQVLGGSLAIASAPGRGTRIRLSVPR